MDQEPKFAWQQYTHDRKDAPSIGELLVFIDWESSRARDVDPRPPYCEWKPKTKPSY